MKKIKLKLKNTNEYSRSESPFFQTGLIMFLALGVVTYGEFFS